MLTEQNDGGYVEEPAKQVQEVEFPPANLFADDNIFNNYSISFLKPFDHHFIFGSFEKLADGKGEPNAKCLAI